MLSISRSNIRCSQPVHVNRVQTPRQVDVPILARNAALATALSLTLMTSSATAAEVQQVFQNSCAGCHAGGGNVVQAGATLKLADLERNGVADPEVLYKVIYGGRGKMPGYGKDCTPKGQCTFGPRLSDEDIRNLTTYILQQAEAGWR